jgi:hypothetical protein
MKIGGLFSPKLVECNINRSSNPSGLLKYRTQQSVWSQNESSNVISP